ncbi:MAG TPA: transglutaminase-like domain-containing protein, partial [Anaerolineales bacterium]
VYDFYSNGGWSNTGASTLDFQPSSQTLNLVNAPDRVESQFQFTMQLPQQSLLYAPSEPVWVNRPGNVMITSASGGENDPLAWFANPPIPQGADYQVRAAIADPSVANLEAAGTNYPSWVVNRYLEVPQNIEPAIQTLAVQIARGKNTPYDQAEAITKYLRGTIQYSITVQPPPPGVDPAVWVLFDTKKGFCNYYASDEVLMLRSIGIPARMAVGFAEGERSGDSFTVLNHDAHAWPEVYFPGIGWIEFEPTVIQNPIVRPAGKSQIANESNNNASSNANSHKPKENSSSESNSASKPLAFNSLLNNILLISFLLLVIGLMIFAFRRYRFLDQMPVYLSNGLGRIGVSTPSWINAWVNWNQTTSAEHSFASINWSLRWLGSPQPIYATAAERAAALIQLLPSAKEYIETVASEHQSALFTKRSPDLVRARRAGMIIILLTLRYKFLRFWSAISGADVYSG